ncbi:hypothetical protein SAMN05421827_1199 [Pedobacter terrae]|uniref:Uncharacterized protein n=1 Tax=Pedobacter terrae TaxID=405671 RepID=A0A1G8AHR3_9SPHI|nr:hypothetical protein SAMN05421827_1199 [Pedobacter terrae]
MDINMSTVQKWAIRQKLAKTIFVELPIIALTPNIESVENYDQQHIY